MCDAGLTRSISCEDIKAAIALPIIVEHEEYPLNTGQYFDQKRQHHEDMFRKMQAETEDLNELMNKEVEQIIEVAKEELKLTQQEIHMETDVEINSIEQWLTISKKCQKQQAFISKIIHDLAEDLKSTEQSRSEGIKKILLKHKNEAVNLRYISVDDIGKIFEEETKIVNLNMVKAFRRYEDVNLQLKIESKKVTDECQTNLKNISRVLAEKKAQELWKKLQERQSKRMLTDAIYNLSQDKFKIRTDFSELANRLARGLSELVDGLQLPTEYDMTGDYWENWVETLNARLLTLDSHCKNVQRLLTPAISSLLENFDDQINNFSMTTGIKLNDQLEEPGNLSEVRSILEKFRRCQADELNRLQSQWKDTIDALSKRIERSKNFVLDFPAIWVNHSARVKKLHDHIETTIMKSYETSLKKSKEKDTRIKGFIKTVREAKDVARLNALCETLKERFHEQVIELEDSYDSQLETMEDLKRKGVEELINEKLLHINDFLNNKYPKKNWFFERNSSESIDSIQMSDSDIEISSQINLCDTYMSAVENRTLGMYEMLERYLPYCEASVKEETEEWLNMFIQDIVNNYDSQVVELDESQNKTLKSIKQIRFAELQIHANRLISHIHGAKHEFSEINTWFEKVKSIQIESLKEFNNKVSIKLAKGNSNDTKMVINELEQEWNCLFNSLKTRIYEGKALCDKKYSEVKEANSMFLKTAKNFKNGGNYSPEELKTLNKELGLLMKFIATQYKTLQKKYDDLAKVISRQFFDSRIEQVHEELKHLELYSSIKDSLSALRLRLRSEVNTIKNKNKAIYERISFLASSPRIDPESLDHIIKLISETKAYMVFPEGVLSLECTEGSQNVVVNTPETMKTERSKKSSSLKQPVEPLFKHTSQAVLNGDNNFLTCTKGLILKKYEHLLQILRQASKATPFEVVKPSTATSSKTKEVKENKGSDVSNEKIRLLKHALLSYNSECELVWLSQTREFLDLVMSLRKHFNTVAESQLSNTHNNYMHGLGELEKRYILYRDEDVLKKEREREQIRKRLVLPLAHPSNHEKLRSLQEKAKETCHFQVNESKELLEKYKNDLQDKHDSYVNAIRTSKDSLTALQTELFADDLCQTLIDNTKGIRDVIPYGEETGEHPLNSEPAYPSSIWSGGNDVGDDSHTPRSICLVLLPTPSNTSCDFTSAVLGQVDRLPINKIAVEHAKESAMSAQRLYDEAKETQHLNEQTIQNWINAFESSVEEAKMLYNWPCGS